MSPIILKYLPSRASQPPVCLQCDKRLLAPNLNPFLNRPISSAIVSRNRHHKNLFRLLKSCPLHFFSLPAGSSLFREVPLGMIWAFDQVSVTLFNILLQSMFVCLVCVFELLYVWLLSSPRNNTCMYFWRFISLVWYRVRASAVCAFKKKRGERKWNSMLNELWSMYRSLLCVVQGAWVNGIHVRKLQK